MIADILAVLLRLAMGMGVGHVKEWTGKPCIFSQITVATSTRW